ncbi:unnamed protein product, partial [Ectocarpus sp. 13 AM-2016]
LPVRTKIRLPELALTVALPIISTSCCTPTAVLPRAKSRPVPPPHRTNCSQLSPPEQPAPYFSPSINLRHTSMARQTRVDAASSADRSLSSTARSSSRRSPQAASTPPPARGAA